MAASQRDERGAHFWIPLSRFEFAGHSGAKPVQHQVFLHADHAVIRAAHAYVGLVSGAAR